MTVIRRFRLSLQIVALLVLAFLWPRIGVALESALSAKKGAIVLIFVVTGLTLNTRQLPESLGKFRVHLLTLTVMFVVFPLVILLTHAPFDGVAGGQLTVGLFAMASLPTTIFSCVVFTSLAGGDSAAALFNSVFANLAGIVVSPILFVFLSRAGNVSLNVDKVALFASVVWLVLLPFAVGQLCRRPLRRGPRNWPASTASSTGSWSSPRSSLTSTGARSLRPVLTQ